MYTKSQSRRPDRRIDIDVRKRMLRAGNKMTLIYPMASKGVRMELTVSK